MFGCISFCIGDKHIEINGKKFSLGDLTTEFLNLPKDKYAAMREQLELAQSKLSECMRSKKLSDWYEANKEYIKLDAIICELCEKRQIFLQKLNSLQHSNRCLRVTIVSFLNMTLKY